MYSPWAASWRSGLGVGAVFLAVALVQIWPILDQAPARLGNIVFSVILGVGLLTGAIAGSFRLGLKLSGCTGLQRKELVIMAVTYLVLFALLYAIPLESHPVAVDMPATEEAGPQRGRVVLSGGGILISFLILPVAVSYGVSRFRRRE